MKTARSFRRPGAGFTLLETLVGLAVGSLTLGGVAVVSISLQRSFEAANYQMTAQNDQLRVLDYLSRDLHMASAVSILDDGGKLSATLPSNDPSSLSLNLGPLLNSLQGGGAGTSSTQAVSYYVEGGLFIRELNGVQTPLADTVGYLNFSRQGSVVTTTVQFTPRFSLSPSAAAQQATQTCSYVYLRNATTVN